MFILYFFKFLVVVVTFPFLLATVATEFLPRYRKSISVLFILSEDQNAPK